MFCQNDANPSILLIFKDKIFVFEHVLYINMLCDTGELKVTAISLVVQLAEAIRTTVMPIRILIRTTVVPITPLIGTTVVRIRILIGTTGI